jgi:cysteinyl-tRNA synthetase
MNADFNMPQALAVMQDFTREVNAILNGDSVVGRAALEALDGFYREYGGGVLGIVPEKAASSADAEREAGIIRLLIDIRREARANKDWATADTIRDRLAELGVSLLDRADGTTWRIS